MCAAILLLWPISGVLGWLWMLCRHDMVDDFWSGFFAVLMVIPAIVAGLLTWIVVWAAENEDEPIRKGRARLNDSNNGNSRSSAAPRSGATPVTRR